MQTALIQTDLTQLVSGESLCEFYENLAQTHSKPSRSFTKRPADTSTFVQVTIFDVLRAWAEKQLEGLNRMMDLFQAGFLYLLGGSGGRKMSILDKRRKDLKMQAAELIAVFGLDKPARFDFNVFYKGL
jgi:hypothetical protein